MIYYFDTLTNKTQNLVKEVFCDWFWISEKMIKKTTQQDREKHLYGRLSKLGFTNREICNLQVDYDTDVFDFEAGTNPSKYVNDCYNDVVKNNIEWYIDDYDWFQKKHMSDPTYKLPSCFN